VAMLGYDNQLRIGELAVALGSPFGLNQTVTAGIVSAVSRPVNGVPMVQTDAAINPGNSGGPLLDGNARVIGINDVIFTEGGGSDGIGFAVAIDLAIVVAEQLSAGLDVELSSLGASTIVASTGESGAIIRDITRGSPAETAGLEVGDRVVAIDGDPIDNPSQLFSSILTHRPGIEVTIDFVRDGTQRQVEVTLVGIQP
jgi:S1-C subfamily serine protease